MYFINDLHKLLLANTVDEPVKAWDDATMQVILDEDANRRYLTLDVNDCLEAVTSERNLAWTPHPMFPMLTSNEANAYVEMMTVYRRDGKAYAICPELDGKCATLWKTFKFLSEGNKN